MHTVLRNVTCIDGTGGEPQPHMTILIRDNRIEAIGPDGSVSYPEDSAVYDAGGRWALPGLIDCHVHITSPGNPDPTVAIKELPSLFAMRATVHARTLLNAGVTTIRDAGSPIYANIALRQAVESGLVPGPRVRACGYGLKMTGGHGDSFYSPIVEIESPGLVDDADQARKVARMNLKMGADHIKIVSASGGVMSQGTEPGVAQFTVEEMRAAVDEAHKAGKRAMAHAHGTQAIKNAILAGIDSVEHGSYLDDEAIEMMLKRGVFLVPTLLAARSLSDHADEGKLPDYVARKAKVVTGDALASFGRAVKAGVKIAMGTDAGVPFNYHGGNLKELALMARGGMTPMQAIVASTRVAAELLDLSDKIGTLAPGKLADIVVVADNPLTNIDLFTDNQQVVQVIKDGAVFNNHLPVVAGQA